MQEAGELTKKAPYDKVVNNKYAEKAVEINQNKKRLLMMCIINGLYNFI